MKKAIVPLTLILFVVLTVFVYINRFSVYYETVDNVYVFNDDTMSSNLTGGVTADSDAVTFETVKMTEKIYSSNQRYFIGESSKKSVSLNYPIISEDNSTLYIQSNLGKYVDSKFTKSDVSLNTIITNAELYSGSNNTRMNEMTYSFLELNSGVYVNLVQLTIETDSHPYVIPVHSYIYFGDTYIRYYYLSEQGEYIYREIPFILDDAKTEVGDEVYTYNDFLILLGIKSISAVVDPDNKAIEPGDGNAADKNEGKKKNKNKDTLKKRGQIVQTERYSTGPSGELYVYPEVHITNFTTNVYSVSFDIEIYDPTNKIMTAPVLSFYTDPTGPGPNTTAEKTPSFSASGHQIVKGLRPDTDYYIQVTYKYKNKTNTPAVDRGNQTNDDGEFRITINGADLYQFGDPYLYHIKTEHWSKLNPINFTWNNPVATTKSIMWNNIKMTNSVDDEVLNGVSTVEIVLTELDGDQKEIRVNVPVANKTMLLAGEAIDFDTKNLLQSNTRYKMEIVITDVTNRKMTVTNGYISEIKTLREAPSASLYAPPDKNTNSDLKNRYINITIDNNDEVQFKTLSGGNRFKFEVYTYVNGNKVYVTNNVLSGFQGNYFDDNDNTKLDDIEASITISNLDILTDYYIEVYCDYYSDGVLYENFLLNKDWFVRTGDASALGVIAFDIFDKDVKYNTVSFTARFNGLSDQVYNLLYDKINIKIKNRETGEYVTHIDPDTGRPTEDYFVDKAYFNSNLNPSTPARFNMDGSPEFKDFLQSKTKYKIEIIPYYVSSTDNWTPLLFTVSESDFTTLKKDAVVNIRNAFKANGYFDFDICVLDPDEAISKDVDGNAYVALNLKNNNDTYYSTQVEVKSKCDTTDFRRFIIDDLNKDISDYIFTLTASAYKTDYSSNNPFSKELYVNQFSIKGADGTVTLNKMIDTAAYDLDMTKIGADSNHINMFDITNTTRWKSYSANSDAYDRKQLLVDENTVKFGSNPKSKFGYAYYIPELAGKPFTISFYVDMDRDITTYNANDQQFCVNNGYVYDSCAPTDGGKGTGNIMSSIISEKNRMAADPSADRTRFVYTFDSLNSGGYITFYIEDKNDKRYNTNVYLTDVKIEYGVPENGDTSFGSADSLSYGGDNYKSSYVAFIDSGLTLKNLPESVNQSNDDDEDDEDDEEGESNNGSNTTVSGIQDGTPNAIGNGLVGSGYLYFNNWKYYSYYLRFFQNNVEVTSLRRRLDKAPENSYLCSPSELENLSGESARDVFEQQCFSSMLSAEDYEYISAFKQMNIDKDKAFEVRITVVASIVDPVEGKDNFIEAGENYIADDEKTELYRLYDIYKYNFTTEIEARSINNENDFINMHAYGNYIVTADLNFTDLNAKSAFAGTFQGTINFQGHKVLVATGGKFRFLFSTIGGGGRVKNLDLHIIFNHTGKSEVLSGFHGLVNSNYGQVNNLMVTTVNDKVINGNVTGWESVPGQDDRCVYEGISDNKYIDLCDLKATHVEYSYNLDIGAPGGILGYETTDAGAQVPIYDTEHGFNESNTVSSAAFRTKYTSLVVQINYGLIDGFVVDLEDPVYLHMGSALIINPHDAGATNQGTVRNGYIYGADVIAPIAAGNEGRGIALIASSAGLNAVIENIYTLNNISIYDNEVIFSPNESDDSKYCLEWDIKYKYGYTMDADGVCHDADMNALDDPDACVIDWSNTTCVRRVMKRNVNNSYSSSLVINSASNAIVRNIISSGDLKFYSNDRYNTNYTSDLNDESLLELPDGQTSQDAIIASAYSTRDVSVNGVDLSANSTSASNIGNIYNISQYNYSGRISRSIDKMYFKDTAFLDEILNTHRVFLTEDAWKANIYPHLDFPSCMPEQKYISLSIQKPEDGLIEIVSVDSVTQDSSKFASGFGNSNLYRRNYFAEIKIAVKIPDGVRIVGFDIEDINKDGYYVDDNKIAIEGGGSPNADGLTIVYLYIKEPTVYKNEYVVSDIYYNTDGSMYKTDGKSKACSKTGELSGDVANGGALQCVNGKLNVTLHMSLFKKVESLEDIYNGIRASTVNFLLTKDINCDSNSGEPGEGCNFISTGNKPFFENVTGVIDGGGHTITGLEVNNCLIGNLTGTLKNIQIKGFVNDYVNNPYGQYGGLICKMGNVSVIDNVHIEDAVVGAGGTGNLYIGGLVGLSYGGFISNSSVYKFKMVEYQYDSDGNVLYDEGQPRIAINNFANMNSQSSIYLGGIAGYAKNIIVNNTFVRRFNVTLSRYTVTPEKIIYGPGDALGVGGIIGFLEFGNVEDVYSTGDIVTEFNNTGGIVGNNGGHIKNCISKVNIIGDDYIGSIAGGDYPGRIIPSNKITKSLALGDILSTNSKSNVRRTSGFLIGMNGNYAWDQQSIDSIYSKNSDGETLLTVQDMYNPLAFSNRVGLSEENWVLNIDYNCPNNEFASNGSSRCASDNHFTQAFRYGQFYDEKSRTTTDFAYIPMLLNAETGKPLPNQGFYQGEPGYNYYEYYTDENNYKKDSNLADLEIRFVEMFSIESLEPTYMMYNDYGTLEPIDEEENYYRADAISIKMILNNPNELRITGMDFDALYIENPATDIQIQNAQTTTTVNIKAVPKYFYDSYQITSITYKPEGQDEKKYTSPISLPVRFYGKIKTKDDWNKIIPGRSQNYLVEKDIDFSCGSAGSCEVRTGLSFNKLRGLKKDYDHNGTVRNPVIRGIVVKNMGSNTGLIDSVSTSIQDLDFDQIYLQSASTGTAFGLIKNLDGIMKPVSVTGEEVMKFSNIRIVAPNISRVGIIANDRSDEVRDIVITNTNITGSQYVGGFIGYGQLKSRNNIKIYNAFIKGTTYVGGYMGGMDDSKARTFDYDILVDGVNIDADSYVGGAFGLGNGQYITVIGRDTAYNASGLDLLSENTTGKVMNSIKTTGGYVGGVVGNTQGEENKNYTSSHLYIDAGGDNVGGISGANKHLYDSYSSFNNISGRNYVGGITGSCSWTMSGAVALSNKVIATNEAAGGIAGALGWANVEKTQVTNDSSSPVKHTIVKAKSKAGGVVGQTNNNRVATISHNTTNAIVLTTNGYAGGVVGYVNNNSEQQTGNYANVITNNYVENAIIVSKNTLAGGLIGGWYKNSVVGKWDVGDSTKGLSTSRIKNNSISASIFCADLKNCGYVNGGVSNSTNGDAIGTSNYYTNNSYSHEYHPSSVDDTTRFTKWVCDSGWTATPATEAGYCIYTTNSSAYVIPAVIDSETGETITPTSCKNYKNVAGTYNASTRKCEYNQGHTKAEYWKTVKYNCTSTDDTYYRNTNIPIPEGTLKGSKKSDNMLVSSNTPTKSSVWCNESYSERDLNYPYIYMNLSINEDTVLAKVNFTNMSLDSAVSKKFKDLTAEANPNSYDLMNGLRSCSGRVRRSASNPECTEYHGSFKKTLSSMPKNSDYFAAATDDYFPYNNGSATIVNISPLPDSYKTAKTYNYPTLTANSDLLQTFAYVVSNVSLMPRVSVYPVDVNMINVEFNDMMANASFEINGREFELDRKVYTFYYDFNEDFDITIKSQERSETLHFDAEDIANNNATIDDYYYYLDDGTVITNADLKSNGYEGVSEEEQEEEEETSDSNEFSIVPGEDNYNNIDSGLVTTSSVRNSGLTYKLSEVEKTTEINNATNIYGDKILLDNKNIYNISTGKTKIDDFENFTLAEEKPLYEFEYAGQTIKTYDKYSTIDGEVINKKLYVKNNKIEVVDLGLDSVNNSYIIDNYNGKEFLIYLGHDGKIHSLKDQIVLPKGFKNLNIKNISSTVGTNTNVMFVEYEDGSYIAFNYRNGNVIDSESNKDISLGEYIRQYYQLSKDKNNYTEENEEYLEAKKLVEKLNDHPIETVIGDNSVYGGIPAKNASYTIAYDPSNNDYYVYQMPTAESTADLKVSDSFNETVDSMINRDEKLMQFYREGESTKVTFVSALIIVLSIVGFIALAIIILAKYLEKNKIQTEEGK